jgi:hypothetical protein
MNHDYGDPFDDCCHHYVGERDDEGRTFLGYLPARAHVEELKRQLDARGLRLDICWRWNGRCRDGVLTLHDAQGRAVYARQFRRNTQLWSKRDETLQRVRSGSPRHNAVVAALEHVLEMR